MTTSEQNAATLRRALEAINARDLALFSELVAPDFVRHDYNGFSVDRHGPAALAEVVHLLLAALPDLRLDVQDILATDDRAAVYARLSGTHHGAFFGVYPSGYRVSIDSVDLYRLQGGKIAESWPWPDLGGIRRLMAQTTS